MPCHRRLDRQQRVVARNGGSRCHGDAVNRAGCERRVIGGARQCAKVHRHRAAGLDAVRLDHRATHGDQRPNGGHRIDGGAALHLKRGVVERQRLRAPTVAAHCHQVKVVVQAQYRAGAQANGRRAHRGNAT